MIFYIANLPIDDHRDSWIVKINVSARQMTIYRPATPVKAVSVCLDGALAYLTSLPGIPSTLVPRINAEIHRKVDPLQEIVTLVVLIEGKSITSLSKQEIEATQDWISYLGHLFELMDIVPLSHIVNNKDFHHA